MKDTRRDAYLTTLGMRVLRFDDQQVLQEIDAGDGSHFSGDRGTVGRKIPSRLPFENGDLGTIDFVGELKAKVAEGAKHG